VEGPDLTLQRLREVLSAKLHPREGAEYRVTMNLILENPGRGESIEAVLGIRRKETTVKGFALFAGILLLALFALTDLTSSVSVAEEKKSDAQAPSVTDSKITDPFDRIKGRWVGASDSVGRPRATLEVSIQEGACPLHNMKPDGFRGEEAGCLFAYQDSAQREERGLRGTFTEIKWDGEILSWISLNRQHRSLPDGTKWGVFDGTRTLYRLEVQTDGSFKGQARNLTLPDSQPSNVTLKRNLK
jgi:hypothetical protein